MAAQPELGRERVVLEPPSPELPGRGAFSGELSHVADYRNPTRYAGKRVIVVGAGDSAAQIANELAQFATVTIATRHPFAVHPQQPGGKDVHYWFRETASTPCRRSGCARSPAAV